MTYGTDLCHSLFFLALPGSLWHLSFPTRNQIQAQAVKVQRPNHWLARECLATLLILPEETSAGFCEPRKNNKERAICKEDFLGAGGGR